MDYGLMFFSSSAIEHEQDKYRVLIEAAKFADQRGFCCLWTPERHFHEFGGLFPNPSVTSAAIATITEKLQIRSGSLISPLHDAIRLAEEWSVVDNLSHGRVGVSFGSGWNVDDFVFYPDRYQTRQEVMYRQIDEIKSLWRGESKSVKNSFGKEVEVRIFPRPIQKELPIWITSSGNLETMTTAGAIGANLLTHLIGQDLAELAVKIEHYRNALAENGFDPYQGKVSLMLHTFMGADVEKVKATVWRPFREYLRTAVKLEIKAAKGGGSISGGHRIDPHNISPGDLEDLLDLTFERYFRSGALMGDPTGCKAFITRLQEIGVDEVACLIDFIDDADAVMESLTYLDELREMTSGKTMARETDQTVAAFLDDLEGEA